jgi:transcriptional regulator with XRE-family HTH domain
MILFSGSNAGFDPFESISMNGQSYAVMELARTLRDARIARGLSQRELAARAGLGQNRLALIETGGVDLRTSTLAQLARALDLELVLTPRRVLPAVQSLTRTPQAGGHQLEPHSVRGTPMRVLRRIQRNIAALETMQPSSEALVQAKSAAQALIEAGSALGASTLPRLRRSARSLALARANKAQPQPVLAKVAAELQELRQMLLATARLEQAPQAERAAYSLDDEIS